MKLNKLSIFILIALCFALCLGAVSAAENSKDVSTISNLDMDVKTTNSTSAQPVSVNPVRTDVDADDVVVQYKKKAYFKVKVEDDDNDRRVKNLKLTIKVYTKSKSKTYTIKTGSNGIAKFNTKVLKPGKHKVVITSEDSKYPVNKKANIFVGKKHTVTLKANSVKKLKNKDKIRVYTVNDDEDKDVKVAFKGSAKHTYVLKAKFYFKNKATGKTIVRTDKVDFDNGRFELPDAECSSRYTPTKVKIEYISI